jgi:hypothetical protein
MSLSDLENGTGTGTQLGDDTLVGGNWRSTARTIGDSIDAEDVQVAVLPCQWTTATGRRDSLAGESQLTVKLR